MNDNRTTAPDERRRTVVKLLAAGALAQFAIQLEDIDAAVRHATVLVEQGQTQGARFFRPEEWQTVRILCDAIIPRDARSGSATDAGVPEFIDFMMTVYPDMQKSMRDGLAWLDAETKRRSRKSFRAADSATRSAVLDAIAFPRRAAAANKLGVEFFTRLRDLTASGFWSSKVGVADLQYVGNRAETQWAGCPPAALRKMGVG